jgi:hypothetical protein
MIMVCLIEIYNKNLAAISMIRGLLNTEHMVGTLYLDGLNPAGRAVRTIDLKRVLFKNFNQTTVFSFML